MKRRIGWTCGIVLAAAMAQAAPAAITGTVTYRENSSPTAGYSHLGIEMRAASSGAYEAGIGALIRTGNLDNNPGVLDMRTGLAFALQNIPAGATIPSVDLYMTAVSGQGTMPQIFAFAVLPGSSGELMVESETGWIQRNASSAWTSAGGDYDPAALTSIASFNAGAISTATEKHFASTAAFIAAAQAALEANRPLELLLVSPDSEDNPGTTTVGDGMNVFVRWASDDASTEANRPRLVVGYSIPEPASLAALMLAAAGTAGRRGHKNTPCKNRTSASRGT